MVTHNHKDGIVFNCSFQHKGQSLNNILLPGPTPGPSIFGVLLRFRQHAVTISGDIKRMFHQIRLLPADKPVPCFLWRNMQRIEETYDLRMAGVAILCDLQPLLRDIRFTAARQRERRC